ncbi:mitochondrial 54S ribosomal protein bL12m [Kwoniella pini CBS 10737]|uniref:Ribosomal protein L7/L12 n=1 Tax=Kwoniella pini CBS 10737 TaxID=1296096 RepID=A0A1B9HZN2_9TREE|nr:ribosomal protein L7/L12 [Kwoniella pini CBS 10737]OCF48724.1 ribosomal protein L7/L12 [Kwoniella pini CBS 10737]
MSLPRTILRSARASSSRLVLARPLSTSRPIFSEVAESSSSSNTPISPKISPIVDQISSLTLLEVSELVSALKTKLNITEIALPAASAAPTASASSSAESAEPAEEKPKEKTIFTVKLEKFEATAKAKIIREVKAIMPNMNLVEAKKFVESVPQTIKENLPKEEAEKLQKTLQDLGATVSLV